MALKSVLHSALLRQVECSHGVRNISQPHRSCFVGTSDLSPSWISWASPAERFLAITNLPRFELELGSSAYGRRVFSRASASNTASVSASSTRVDIERWNLGAREERLKHLEEQALQALRATVDTFEHPAFPCALIAGDVVLLHLLHKLGYLSNERVKVIFIDTFHLFPETYKFLHECEEAYGFKAHVFQAAGLNSKEEYNDIHGSDLFIRDIDEYDRICKVEPFARSLTTLKVDAMINGRRRDHGAERAHLETFEDGDVVKVQPLAYWEFRDCFEYLEKYNVPKHPLHDEGFPSVGDVQTTLPIPKTQWFEYGGERSGRFQGLKNKDGSEKTECGIHVGGSSEIGQGPASSSLSSSI